MAGLPARVRCALTGSFAAATAVQPATPGEWAGSIAPGWEIAGNANGGYLLAMAARALAGAAGRPDPVTVTAHYLSPGRTGDVRIATQILKDGKRFATGTATMFAGDRPLLAVLGSLRCRFATRFVTAGFLEEDGEVWDSTGRLVGQARQLALVPRG